MKFNLFLVFFFFFSFFFLKNPLKFFHSIHLFFLIFGLDTYKTRIYLSSQLFFKTPHETLKFHEKFTKNEFSSDLQT